MKKLSKRFLTLAIACAPRRPTPMEQIHLNPATDPDRRLILKSAVATVAAFMCPAGYAGTSGQALSFTAVPASLRDTVVVPPEYEYQVIYRWGDPTGIGSALGMQFHLEVTPTLLEEWLDESSMVKDLKAVGGSKSQLREAFAEYNPQLQPLADQVFSSFAARCNSYGQNLAQAQQG